MKLEFVNVDPPQDAWIVTRARTLRGLPPLKCQVVQHVVNGDIETAAMRPPMAKVVKIGSRKRAYPTREIVLDAFGANVMAGVLLDYETHTAIARRTNAALADNDARHTLGRGLKAINDARKKIPLVAPISHESAKQRADEARAAARVIKVYA